MPARLIRRLLLVAGLLGCMLLAGTAGLVITQGYGWFDAFYMTLATVTTLGYQRLWPATEAGRIFNSFLILFGVTAMFFAVGAMTQTIIEMELQDLFGQHRRRRMMEKLQDHFIVCGFGRVGRNASFQLQAANAQFAVIDRSTERVARATAAGMVAGVADATQDEALRAAGVLRARGLISALPSDAENLFIILSAKALNPGLTVVTRASEEEAGEKLRRAGADIVLTPYSMAGRQLADALLRPKVVEFLDLERGTVGPAITIEQVRIGPGVGRSGSALGSLAALRDPRVIVLAVRRHQGETIFNPGTETAVNPGDFLIVMGERAALHKLDQVLTG